MLTEPVDAERGIAGNGPRGAVLKGPLDEETEVFARPAAVGVVPTVCASETSDGESAGSASGRGGGYRSGGDGRYAREAVTGRYGMSQHVAHSRCNNTANTPAEHAISTPCACARGTAACENGRPPILLAIETAGTTSSVPDD